MCDVAMFECKIGVCSRKIVKMKCVKKIKSSKRKENTFMPSMPSPSHQDSSIEQYDERSIVKSEEKWALTAIIWFLKPRAILGLSSHRVGSNACAFTPKSFGSRWTTEGSQQIVHYYIVRIAESRVFKRHYMLDKMLNIDL